MTALPLTRGYWTVIDEADLPLVEAHRWYTWIGGKYIYAATKIKGRTVLMHRVIMGVDGDTLPRVDHVDGNGLNNQRTNLRLATSAQNVANSGPREGRRYKGANRTAHGWRAVIRVNYRQRHLGVFTSEEEAARAYDRAALTAFGDFAKTNFPVEEYTK